MPEATVPRRNTATYVLCFLATVMEGYALQSAGAVAPKFAPDLHLNPGQVGWVFTSSIVGLFMGASFGGWLADRIGRKSVLVASMATFALFSLGTSLADNFGILWLMRLLTGIGLGGALPNVISLVAEASPPAERATRVTLLSAGIPIGGLITVMVVLFAPPQLGWRGVFALGGWVPLALSPVLALALPESASFVRAQSGRGTTPRVNTALALFGEGRAMPTLLLWTTFFFTQIVLYVMINWLPSLMVANGFSRHDATRANLGFAVGSALGALILGWLTKRLDAKLLLIVTFVAAALGLMGLTVTGSSLPLTILAAFVVGFFIIGCQFLLYGISPAPYPVQVRATGVGWAIAIGRLGAVAGPALGGVMLAHGSNPSEVLRAIAPGLAIGLATGLMLVWKPMQVLD